MCCNWKNKLYTLVENFCTTIEMLFFNIDDKNKNKKYNFYFKEYWKVINGEKCPK